MYKDDGINWIKVLPDKRIFIFGAGFNGKRLYQILNTIDGCEVAGFIDNNSQKINRSEGEIECPLKCYLLEEYKKIEDKNDLIIISTAVSEIGRQLFENHIYHYVAWDQIDFSIVGERHYDENYFAIQIDFAKVDSELDSKFFQPYIKASDRIAEFGCGGGLLLEKLNCFSKIGIEINPVARKYAQNSGITTVKNFEEIDNESLDVIISTHALEHCVNPYEVVANIFKKLKATGKCICVVPYEPLSYEYLKNDISQHLYIWNQRTLGNLFRAVGFYIRETGVREVAWPDGWKNMFHEKAADWFNALSVLESDRTGYYSVYVVAEK